MTTGVAAIPNCENNKTSNGDFKFRFVKSPQFSTGLRAHLKSDFVFNPLPEATLGKEVSREMCAEIPCLA